MSDLYVRCDNNKMMGNGSLSGMVEGRDVEMCALKHVACLHYFRSKSH